jgi:hypothetical protein
MKKKMTISILIYAVLTLFISNSDLQAQGEIH